MSLLLNLYQQLLPVIAKMHTFRSNHVKIKIQAQ